MIDIQQFASLSLFSGLSAGEIESVLSKAQKRGVAAAGFFFMQGDPAEALLVLSRGRVKILQVTTDGQQLLLRVITPPAMFGVVAMVPGADYPVSAEADEDSQAFYWSQASMMEQVKLFPQLAVNAMKFMAGQVREFQDRFRELATERVERRLARTIIRLAGQLGKKTPEGVLIDLPLTRQDLAEMTGTTLYTVSRTLSAWEAQGLVLSGRERLTVRYPHGLVRIAEDI